MPIRMATASMARSIMITSTASTNGAVQRRTPSASVMRIAPGDEKAQVRPMTSGARSRTSIQSSL